MRDSLFIPAEVLTKLVEGSHEALITRVRALVAAERATIFGEGAETVEVRVCGTYPRHAILASTDAARPIVRIEYAATAGVLRLVKHEVVPVPTYDVGDATAYAHQESRRAVDAMLTGNLDEASARLGRAMRHAPSSSRGADVIVADLRAHLHAARVWRTATSGAQVATVRAVLGEAYDAVAARRPAPRAVAASPEAESVRAATTTLLQRFDLVGTGARSARQRLATNRTHLRETASVELATFDAISEDLVRDVASLRGLVAESLRALDKFQNLAQVYDALADALFEYEIAQAFIASLVERLAR